MNKLLPPHLGILHGGDYNPDQWLDYPEILQKDVELMKQAGINCVSLGIFAWAKLEPQEGVYDFDWLEQIIDNLYSNGIYTILATPSGAKPLWMSEKYEEIRRVAPDLTRNLSGSRHNHCYTSPVYREKVREINTRLSERFANNPAVIMWHISNEYGGECYCPLCQAAFMDWLKVKYKTIDNLNHAWWTAFWSHTYQSFDQINAPVPNGETSVHGLTLDWKRFVTHQTVDFMQAEIAAVKTANPDLPVTTNMMGFYNGLNYFKFADRIDIVSFDSYPAWHSGDNTDVAASAAFSFDLMRGVKGKNWLLMESTPSQTNWQHICKLKRPGLHEASSLQALAHGSDSVQYFQIRKSRGSCEKFHGAVIDHYGKSDTRVFSEVAALGERLKSLGGISDSAVKSQVAIVYDWENRWAIETSAALRNGCMNYVETVEKHHRAFWNMGINTDIIDMECALDGYKIVIAPMLYMYRAGFENKMRDFVKNGGILVGTYNSGIVNDTDLCYLGGVPGGGMADVFGLISEETDALFDGEYNGMIYNGKHYDLSEICTIVRVKSAEILSTYESDFYKGTPALTVNSFGSGKAYYMSSLGDTEFFNDFYGSLAAQAKMSRALDADLPHGVTAHVRKISGGEYIFVENYSGEPKQLNLDGSFTIAESGELVSSLNLNPYDVAVLMK